MGVPVSPRNIFPSNIQGLPTWYEVRVTEAGHLGARGGVDLMVAMNPQTWDKDVAVDRARRLPVLRLDQADAGVEVPRRHPRCIGVPLTAICNATYTDPRQRQLFKNIIYVGALSALLDMDPAVIEQLIGEQFKGKEKLIRLQRPRAASRPRLGARQPECPIGLRVQKAGQGRRPHLRRRQLRRGRAARSMAARRSAPGIRSRRRRRWPTPSPATASGCAIDPETKKTNYAIVQGEDEIASIGIVVGAGWNGARAFTATSGPGISLMTGVHRPAPTSPKSRP